MKMTRADLIRHIRDDRLHKGWADITPLAMMNRWNLETLEAAHQLLHERSELPLTHPHAG